MIKKLVILTLCFPFLCLFVVLNAFSWENVNSRNVNSRQATFAEIKSVIHDYYGVEISKDTQVKGRFTKTQTGSIITIFIEVPPYQSSTEACRKREVDLTRIISGETTRFQIQETEYFKPGVCAGEARWIYLDHGENIPDENIIALIVEIKQWIKTVDENMFCSSISVENHVKQPKPDQPCPQWAEFKSLSLGPIEVLNLNPLGLKRLTVNFPVKNKKNRSLHLAHVSKKPELFHRFTFKIISDPTISATGTK